MKPYRPPLTLTHSILKLSESISRQIGRLEGAKMVSPPLTLRRTNQVKTIHASLAIEGNTLSLDQITDLLAGKHVLGPSKDILEVKNALTVYENLHAFNPLDIHDFLSVHKMLMHDLVSESGDFRSKGVGIFQGATVAHIAPPAKRIPKLMQDLFDFLNHATDMSWLLKSCVFHYELEFIHPFMDGNGRMGRLWQQLLLMKEHPVFAFIPVEEMIKENQAKYYAVLGESDRVGESTAFVQFSLEVILAALMKYGHMANVRPNDVASRLDYARQNLSKEWFARKDYLAIHPDISMPTASRDLIFGLNHNILASQGERNQVRYQWNRSITD